MYITVELPGNVVAGPGLQGDLVQHQRPNGTDLGNKINN